jgi:hypothetical protein
MLRAVPLPGDRRVVVLHQDVTARVARTAAAGPPTRSPGCRPAPCCSTGSDTRWPVGEGATIPFVTAYLAPDQKRSSAAIRARAAKIAEEYAERIFPHREPLDRYVR